MNFILKIYYYILITRPLNIIITLLVVIVGALISKGETYETTNIILAGISAILTAAAGNIINDIIDKNADKINHPVRIIPSGKLSVKQAGIEYFFLVIAACVISSFINQLSFLIVFLTSVLLFLYSNILKRIPLLGNITIAYLTGMAFIYGGVSVGHPRAALIPALFAFMINLIRELVKDIQDIDGDKNVGIKTFPIKFGIDSTKYLITFFVILLILTTFIPYAFDIYKIEFFILVMIVVNPILIFFLKLLYKNDFTANLNKLSNMLKLDMVFGLLAIFLGV
ncbi:geranylgeranylglycerol-phosphate geranylgeranyltransferase [bacterium BMS3Abin03]|jgi:geranylgeranylglycerol-phosphate geranylgeranyltransferase|nr:geranylgeranylglycerol-phosphate geranylgeranyltransferase [bacterium BMS3Abin03]MCG6958575.1 geranylgeranylglycerol-phosphate geranylgeranyltransferase [bacterium BMS3Abin03]